MKKQLSFGFAGAMLLGISLLGPLGGCKNDPEQVYNPTSVEVELPDFVSIYLGNMPTVSDNPLTEEGIALGKKLFYERKLSDNNTLSCAGCHKPEEAFSDKRPFSEGTNGAPGNRNAMPIINLAWANHFFWDGRRNSLESQAHDPVINPVEMRNTWPTVINRLQADSTYPDLFFAAFGTSQIDSNLVVKAIAQFERTMVSFNSRFDKYYFQGQTNALSSNEISGMDIFFGKGHCNDCHSDVLLTDNLFRNNGLDEVFTDRGLGQVTQNPTDDGKFKVPTLRNIALTPPYMHDSRFATLEQVITHYSNGIKPNSPNLDEHLLGFGNGFNFTEAEKNSLLAFLKTFTDSSFISNPKFIQP